MARIKIEVPDHFNFTTVIPVRITDLNYGGHVGNDSILSMIHEARVQFLRSKGYEELDMAGVGLIMSDVVIEFKNELFYGESIVASVAAGELSKIGFDLFYKLEKKADHGNILLANAKTGMVCYDYRQKKISALPEEAKNKLMDQSA